MQPGAAAAEGRARGQATRAARGGARRLHAWCMAAAWRLAARRAWLAAGRRLAGGWPAAPAVAAAKVGKSSGAEKPFFAIS
jgi:hypothetical protein